MRHGTRKAKLIGYTFSDTASIYTHTRKYNIEGTVNEVWESLYHHTQKISLLIEGLTHFET